jgi:lysine 2,3-aminomutase
MLGAPAIEAALAYIAGRKEIFEVILTGGDPLVLSARRLGALLRRLAAIPHVKVLRIHTRVPIAAPERITTSLTNALRRAGRPVYVAVHANHPRELTPPARAALARLADAGVQLLSQTVLLKGVNNDAEVLETLMRAFVELRVRPYYLHHPDLAPGTARFRLSLEEGRALVRALRGRVSGLCQPTYVLDVPGGHGKAPVAESFAAPSKDGGFLISSPLGGTVPYPPTTGAQETLAQTKAAKSSRARGSAPPPAAEI